MQGEAWACGRDQGRARTVLGRRCAYAAGAGAYGAFLEIVVENVDSGQGEVAGGSLRGRAAVRAAEATAATAATMVVVTAAVMVAWTAVWAASVAPKVAAARAVVGGWQRWRQQLW